MTRGPGRHLAVVAVATVLLAAANGCILPSMSRSVAVWVVGGDEELTFDTPPSPENDIFSASRGRISLKAALNETLGLQVALRGTAPPAGPFDLRIGSLVGPSGELPATLVTKVYRVHYSRVADFQAWYSRHTGKPATPTLFPDKLVPWAAPRGGGPIVLAEPRNELIWIDLHVPLTASPGEYTGRLEVVVAGRTTPVFACDIRLEVLPVAIPDRRSLPVVCRVDPRDLLAAHLRWPRGLAEDTRLLPNTPSHLAAVRLVNETMRLFHEHRATPILWASFPKYRLAGDRSVEIEWDEYDRLVAGWIDGSAFPDRVRLEVWPVPVSLEYPSASRNGGLDSPRYARLLAAYLDECRRHFAERGWLDRAVLRPCPPEPLTRGAVDRLGLVGAIVRQSEADFPLIAHLPARSLRGLGWHGAPSIDLGGVDIWAPPAMCYEPDAMRQQRTLGRQAWFMPDQPPYSGSLAVEAPPNDQRCLAWQAYRYGATGLWIEHAAELNDDQAAADDERGGPEGSLIHAADEYGPRDRPLASLRLKRLRRGLLDYELLRLLENNGKRLLAQELAEQVVRWAGTDACVDNLLSCKSGGWPARADTMRLARTLMLRELAGEFEPNPAARRSQIDTLAQWGRMMSRAEHVAAAVDGVRLSTTPSGLRADVIASVQNTSNRAIGGQWTLPTPPPGWQPPEAVGTTVPPGTRRPVRLELDLAGLAYNVDGVYPFELAFDTEALGLIRVPARLAVAVCKALQVAPRIDGRLDDWPLAASNSAGDFRLCRTPGPTADPDTDLPARPTRAFFAFDGENLYLAARCGLMSGETPTWLADNDIPVDGDRPWGQDVVEVLLDSRGTSAGTGSDLYCLQIKPSGMLIARRGCRTEPPMYASEPWHCGARVAVSVEREAWIVELSVPLAAFEPAALRQRVWGLNVTRLDARHGEYSSWSGARGHCYSPATLGNLILLWP